MFKAVMGHQKSVDVDSTKSLFAAIYLGIIGPAIFIVQPGFVQGLVEYYGFGESQAGYVAAAEMWGIALSTLALTFVSDRVNWRTALAWAAVLATVGNLLSTLTTEIISFSVMRFLVGLGSGILISLTFTIIGLTANPDRNFGFLIMWILVYGAIGFLLLPIGFSSVGMTGVLIVFGLFNLTALLFVKNLPVSSGEHAQSVNNEHGLSNFLKRLAVGAIFVYFIAQGVVWAYLFLIGTYGGATEAQVTHGLTLSQFAGVAGALTAAMVADKFGRISPLVLGVSGSVISLAMLLSEEISPFGYVVAVCVFNYAWNMTHPFLLAALASFDKSGRIVVYGVAGQMMGLAIGPALAAYILTGEGYSNVIWLGVLLFVMSIFMVIPPLLKQRQIMQ